DGAEEDHEFHPEGDEPDVVEVVFELLAELVDGGGILVFRLRPPGEAGLDGKAKGELGDLLLDPRDVLRPLRARSDDRHVAAEDVPKLRELVDAGLAHEATNARDARVILRGELGAGGLRIGPHRAELVDAEEFAVLTEAILAIEHGASRVELDREDDQRHQRQDDQAEDERGREIRHTFDGADMHGDSAETGDLDDVRMPTQEEQRDATERLAALDGGMLEAHVDEALLRQPVTTCGQLIQLRLLRSWFREASLRSS